MAPFPTRRATSHQDSLLPTTNTSAAYPPPSPAPSRTPSPAPAPISTARPEHLFGTVARPSAGVSGGLGRSASSTGKVQELLQDNHINRHTFFNEDGFHNHAAHHLLTSYALGAGPTLLKEIYELHSKGQSKPMLPLQPATINETNWLEFLGEEQYYPNYLAFFHRLISQPPTAPSPYTGAKSSVVPVVEKYLLGGQGDMLVRAVSGAIHGLINIGYGIEFALDALVAEGLAQSAVTSARLTSLFPAAWPPMPPRPSQLHSTISSAFSSLKFGGSAGKRVASSVPFLSGLPVASPSRDNFARTASRLDRDGPRIPRAGLGGFTVLDRILHDPNLAAGRAGRMDDFPKLDKVLEREGERIVRWCEEWKFEGEEGAKEWDEDGERERARARREGREGFGKSPSWEECVEKCEELMWMATVIYAASSRPGYTNTKLDFFLMHGLTSSLFLPSILQAISPHLRPYLLHSHFRVMVAYWVSRGRPDLYIRETLMAASACPFPPGVEPASTSAIARKAAELSEKEGEAHGDAPESPKTPQAGNDGKLRDFEEEEHRDEQGVESVWPRMLASAVDHPDDHFAKVIRALAFAAAHFGHSPKGLYHSALPGTEVMDGSIFARAAGLTFRSLGWAHEGQTPLGAWDRSSLGYDEAWEEEERIPGWVDSASRSDKGKGRARSGTETEETYLNSRATSPSLGAGTRSPTILSPAPQVAGQGWYQSSTPERVRSPEVAAETRVDFGGSEPVRDDERTRREVEDDDERELMA